MTSELSTPVRSQAELLALFMGPRAQSYLNLPQGQTAAFSWAGLIFGIYWLLYRKMYAYFFLALACGLFFGVISQIIGVSAQYAVWLGLMPNLVLGCIGKRLYAEFGAGKVKAYLQNAQYSEKVFAEAGGTALSMPLLWLFTQIGLVMMLTTPFLKY